MSRRINARIDEELARKLEELGKLTGQSASAILKLALDAYYARVRGAPGHAKQALRAAGFVACATGDADLSVRYKDELRGWGDKT
ncbi:MAG TPA: ribbon-helix-helix protein, CopG family [Polyangiales bacterium]|nr:ribbon-helix-helix protein, CopG family [Polyangiales bacterium]